VTPPPHTHRGYTVARRFVQTPQHNGASVSLPESSAAASVEYLVAQGMFPEGGTLTCLQSGVIRLRLLVEIFRLMDMPVNCRLLFPKILDRAFEGG